MSNFYEDRLAAKRDRLEERADRARASGAARVEQARQLADAIPFGQPILVDHYSARRHRRDLDRIDSGYRRGFGELDKADRLAERAETLGGHGVASDDPDAVVKLKEKLARLEARQALMKAANAAIRKHAKAGREAQSAALVDLGFTADEAAEVTEPGRFGGLGFPSYHLSNRSAEMRRVRKRIEELSALVLDDDGWAREGTAADGTAWKMSLCEGRYVLVFEARCDDEVRRVVRSHGFVWARSRGAWTRKVTANAARSVERLVVALSA